VERIITTTASVVERLRALDGSARGAAVRVAGTGARARREEVKR
jgi:hypothetical protein